MKLMVAIFVLLLAIVADAQPPLTLLATTEGASLYKRDLDNKLVVIASLYFALCMFLTGSSNGRQLHCQWCTQLRYPVCRRSSCWTHADQYPDSLGKVLGLHVKLENSESRLLRQWIDVNFWQFEAKLERKIAVHSKSMSSTIQLASVFYNSSCFTVPIASNMFCTTRQHIQPCSSAGCQKNPKKVPYSRACWSVCPLQFTTVF